MSAPDPIAAFTDTMRQRGIVVPKQIIADGLLHRCDVDGGKAGKDDAAYVLHLDGVAAGGCINWKDGQGWENWSAKPEASMSEYERRKLRSEIERQRRLRDEEEKQRRADAVERAKRTLEAATPSGGDHAYLRRKGVLAHGIHVHRQGPLIIPIHSVAGDLMSLQFIAPDGGKRFLTGGTITGGNHLIGAVTDKLVIAEGYATAATIHEATGWPLAVAFDAGNLEPVARAWRAARPDLHIIIAADDDHRTEGNPGLTKARKAADSVGGAVLVPDFGPNRPEKATDWNDLAALSGLDAVKRQFEALNRTKDDEPLGDEPPPVGDADAIEPAPVAPVKITASPFVWRDPATIPRREWLYGHHLIRKFVSLTVAPGATGKSSLLIADALALVTGRDLIGTPVYDGPKRVWLWNLEDPRDEIERRIVATMIRYEISPDDIGKRLFLDSGRDQELCIAHQDRHGFSILEPVVDALVAELVARQIAVLVVDPFVSSHTVSENDNGAIDAVAKTWGKVAERANCAVELVHHLRKLGGVEATAESTRGAVSLVAAARSCRVLNRMTAEEAEKAGVETHRGHFRTVDDKNNLAPPAADADWFRMVSVNLPNGDNVGVVEPWEWPNALDDVTVADLVAVQKAVHGKGCRAAPQSKEWVGHTVSEVLGLDVTDKAARSKVSSLLKTWIKNGALKVVEVMDSARRPRATVEVGEWATVGCSSAPVPKSQTGADWRSGAKAPCSSAPVAPVPSVRGTGNWSGADPGRHQ